MNELLYYLKTRRSALAMTLRGPAPDAGEVWTMIEIASRVPDHCKMAPWRFIEYTPKARKRLAELFAAISNQEPDQSRKESRQKQIDNFRNAPLAIGVVSSPRDNPKVPEWEQVLSAGAAVMQLLMAANALGYEAQWLSGFYMFNKEAINLLELGEREKLAGMIHIGSSAVVKKERSRPDIDDVFKIVAD